MVDRTNWSELPPLDEGLETIEGVKVQCARFRDLFSSLADQVHLRIVGQDEVVDQTLVGLLADGHVLLEGVPGLGKTLLVQTLSESLGLGFSRIQFTPDLMPSDMTGTNLVIDNPATGAREFRFREGPIFQQLILADEINRATPKTQSALLEAMQEKTVTAGGMTRPLTRPFFVMATQNPIEQEGTFALPEAQLDRFLIKIVVPYTTSDELKEILDRTTGGRPAALAPILDADRIMQAQRLACHVIVSPQVKDYCIRLVLATQPGSEFMPRDLEHYISVGVSPRAAQALIRVAKVSALIDGRYAISFEDIRKMAAPVLRHRIIRTFEAEADGVGVDQVIDRLLESVGSSDEQLQLIGGVRGE
ncbi:MAG: AAA family ATPase [Phycisphaerae bacterium]|nr:AAA family ATPase [Phycisphaerae bacterium]